METCGFEPQYYTKNSDCSFHRLEPKNRFGFLHSEFGAVPIIKLFYTGLDKPTVVSNYFRLLNGPKNSLVSGSEGKAAVTNGNFCRADAA